MTSLLEISRQQRQNIVNQLNDQQQQNEQRLIQPLSSLCSSKHQFDSRGQSAPYSRIIETRIRKRNNDKIIAKSIKQRNEAIYNPQMYPDLNKLIIIPKHMITDIKKINQVLPQLQCTSSKQKNLSQRVFSCQNILSQSLAQSQLLAQTLQQSPKLPIQTEQPILEYEWKKRVVGRHVKTEQLQQPNSLITYESINHKKPDQSSISPIKAIEQVRTMKKEKTCGYEDNDEGDDDKKEEDTSIIREQRISKYFMRIYGGDNSQKQKIKGILNSMKQSAEARAKLATKAQSKRKSKSCRRYVEHERNDRDKIQNLDLIMKSFKDKVNKKTRDYQSQNFKDLRTMRQECANIVLNNFNDLQRDIEQSTMPQALQNQQNSQIINNASSSIIRSDSYNIQTKDQKNFSNDYYQHLNDFCRFNKESKNSTLYRFKFLPFKRSVSQQNKNDMVQSVMNTLESYREQKNYLEEEINVNKYRINGHAQRHRQQDSLQQQSSQMEQQQMLQQQSDANIGSSSNMIQLQSECASPDHRSSAAQVATTTGVVMDGRSSANISPILQSRHASSVYIGSQKRIKTSMSTPIQFEGDQQTIGLSQDQHLKDGLAKYNLIKDICIRQSKQMHRITTNSNLQHQKISGNLNKINSQILNIL